MIAGRFIAVILIGYLLGAIPFGVVIGRLTRGVDVREYGSGRTGVANVMRTAGRGAGAMVFILDAAKSAVAIIIAWAIFGLGDPMLDPVLSAAMAAGAFAAIIGHNWSIYIRFQGGRGVTASFGGFMVMAWQVALPSFILFLLIVALSRYMSLGSILGSATAAIVMIPLFILDIEPLAFLVYAILAAGLIIFRHRDNIARLRAGTEPKIGERARRMG